MLPKSSDQNDLGSLAQRSRAISAIGTQGTQLETTLGELHTLLQSYAPQWYSSALNGRVEFALRERRESLANVFIEVYDLLEVYAPSWYTQEQHKTAESVKQSLKRVDEPPTIGKRSRGAASS